jgi:hypothetical protein
MIISLVHDFQLFWVYDHLYLEITDVAPSDKSINLNNQHCYSDHTTYFP